MVKILFLDVDGVINVPHGMDKNLLTNLKDIVESTGCKIVVSSDWRSAADTRAELKRILRMFGLDFIACTPPSKSKERRRPEEILKFIACHNMAMKQGQGGAKLADLGPVEQWVAIDDRPLLSEPGGKPGLVGHFVQTQSATGLTAQCAQMAKNILMCNAALSPMSSSTRAMTKVSACLSHVNLTRPSEGSACGTTGHPSSSSQVSIARSHSRVSLARRKISMARSSSSSALTTVTSLPPLRSCRRTST